MERGYLAHHVKQCAPVVIIKEHTTSYIIVEEDDTYDCSV